MSLSRPVRVLVVEDSPSMRKLLEDLFAQAGDFQLVGQARDGQEALRLALELSPDVVVLDLEMPRMDGFTFLRFYRAQSRRPVLVLSRHSGRGDVRRALDLGANAFVPKPQLGAGAGSPEARTLVERVRSLVDEQAQRPPGGPTEVPSESAGPSRGPRVALLGASTGGPTAVQQILAALPGDLPLAVVVAQHMPARFTPAFAARLDRASAFSVAEAKGGEGLVAGNCLVAPGGKSAELIWEKGEIRVRLRQSTEAERYVPSVDLLFASAAAALGPWALGVILTGMGDDGRDGLREIRRVGGRTLAESAESAVVFGMPKAAIDAGGVEQVLSLPEIIRAIIRFSRGA